MLPSTGSNEIQVRYYQCRSALYRKGHCDSPRAARDTSYGAAVTRRLRAMGIRDRPITPRSPWQNGHVERLTGSIRRECLDHVVVLGERHLRHLLANYAVYYKGVRTHLALDKDTPHHRPAQTVGRIASVTWLGGLHRYSFGRHNR